MGCAGSVPLPQEVDEHGQPPRTQHEPDAAQLVLTTRGSFNQLVLAEHSRLAAHMPNVPLTLASHPGLAIVTTGPNSGPHMCMWMVAPLGVGSAHNAVTATLRPDDFLVYTHGGPPGKVLDVAFWSYEAGSATHGATHGTVHGGGTVRGGGAARVAAWSTVDARWHFQCKFCAW